MAMHRLAEIADALVRGGLPAATPTAVIAAATLAEERIVVSTLERVAADVRKERIEPPAIVVVGEIVSARDQLRGTAASVESQST
jgi:uroporphyrin-III C-methyltransferase